MPVYLFTFHTYGSWLPDREQGYISRKDGLHQKSQEEADRYRYLMRNDAVSLNAQQQRFVIHTVLQKCEIKNWTLHAAACETTHVHLLIAWQSLESWLKVRSGLKASITRYLNQNIGKRKWLSGGGSRKRVTDETHFNHLLVNYLPSHRGWRYDRKQGWTDPNTI